MHKYLTVRWKTEKCWDEGCWCSMIVPENKDEMDDCVIPASVINTEIAEHIVKLHNKVIDDAAKDKLEYKSIKLNSALMNYINNKRNGTTNEIL